MWTVSLTKNNLLRLCQIIVHLSLVDMNIRTVLRRTDSDADVNTEDVIVMATYEGGEALLIQDLNHW